MKIFFISTCICIRIYFYKELSMKVLPISNNQVFKGYSKYISNINDNDCLLFDCHRLYFNDADSLAGVLRQTKIPVPNPSVEKTLGSFHTKSTGQVYFANPKEIVNDYLRSKHDYIVYDNEPSYPDVNKEVSRNYFGTERKNYGQDYQEIYEYYKRLENADWKTLDEIKHDNNMPFDTKREKAAYYEHRIDESKYQEDQAKTCKRIYEEGNGLRTEKEYLEDKNSDNERRIKELNNKKNKNEIEIANERQRNVYRRRYLETLGERVQKYEELKKYTESCIDTAKGEKEELIDLLLKRTREKEKLTADLIMGENKISQLSKENQEVPALIKNLQNAIVKNNTQIADIKAKLIPIFDKLKNYYASQGIKIIKRI